MITVTPDAAQQIRIAATQSDADELGLRIAARRDEQGALHYAMGFDEAREGDVVVPSEGIALVVAASDRELLEGLTDLAHRNALSEADLEAARWSLASAHGAGSSDAELERALAALQTRLVLEAQARRHEPS